MVWSSSMTAGASVKKASVSWSFWNFYFLVIIHFELHYRSYGVMVSTLDFESSNPSSNLGRTSLFSQFNWVSHPLRFSSNNHSIDNRKKTSASHFSIFYFVIEQQRFHMIICMLGIKLWCYLMYIKPYDFFFWEERQRFVYFCTPNHVKKNIYII